MPILTRRRGEVISARTESGPVRAPMTRAPLGLSVGRDRHGRRLRLLLPPRHRVRPEAGRGPPGARQGGLARRRGHPRRRGLPRGPALSGRRQRRVRLRDHTGLGGLALLRPGGRPRTRAQQTHRARPARARRRRADPEAVQVRNWVPLDDDDEFAPGVDRLVEALDTDLDWTRGHTRWLLKALEWEAENRDRSFLLRGAELAGRRELAGLGAGKQPEPSSLHREYLLSSRIAAARRLRLLVGAMASHWPFGRARRLGTRPARHRAPPERDRPAADGDRPVSRAGRSELRPAGQRPRARNPARRAGGPVPGHPPSDVLAAPGARQLGAASDTPWAPQLRPAGLLQSRPPPYRDGQRRSHSAAVERRNPQDAAEHPPLQPPQRDRVRPRRPLAVRRS